MQGICSLPSAEPCSSSGRAAHDLGIGVDLANWFVQNRPELLPADRLKTRLHGMAKLLCCTDEQAAALLKKQPLLIDEDSVSIRQRLAALATALGGDVLSACRAARRVPLLLTCDRELVARMKLLSKLLGLDSGRQAKQKQELHHRRNEGGISSSSGGRQPETWASGSAVTKGKLEELVEKEPSLLVLPLELLRERLLTVPVLFDLPTSTADADAQKLCCEHPWLLTVSGRSVSSKITALRASLRMSRRAVLQLVLHYPKVLTFSEQAQAAKVAALTEGGIPLAQLQTMVCLDPSLLARSSDKVLASLRALQQATSISMTAAVSLAERRPAILSKSPLSSSRCYRALSIWKLTKEEKLEMIQKHPLLMQMSPSELHRRCRWLRSLIDANGWYHAGLRRVDPPLLAVIIMHLPKAWSRWHHLTYPEREMCRGNL